MSQRLIITLFGACLIAAAIGLIRFTDSTTTTDKQHNSLASLLPDFIIKDFNSQQFDSTGKLQYEMDAKKLTHYPLNDVTELSLPTMNLKGEESSYWAIQAKRGFIASEGNLIELKGDVTLTKQLSPGDALLHKQDKQAQPITMLTDTLLVHLDKKIAETNKPVIISSTDSVIESIGMQVDFANNRLTLRSNVRGRHHVRPNH